MTTITVVTDRHGDMNVHVAGCSDIKKSHRMRYDGDQPQNYKGADLVAAIVAVDTDYADAFGQDAYDPDPDDMPWTVDGMVHAPCFKKAVKAAGITFGPAGRPVAS